MKLQKRIEILNKLGEYLQSKPEELQAVMLSSKAKNQWFTLANQQQALEAIAQKWLKKEKLEAWVDKYKIEDTPNSIKKVGLVLAGNIPLVGFHDFLTVFISGHHAQIKLSSKDEPLFKALLMKMGEIEPEANSKIEVAERLQGFDAVIATGSSNSSRYFDYYFGKYPNIIRKNRSSVAVLSGKESEAELLALGHDVFSYFGLGCRNVSKFYVPEGYDFPAMLDTWEESFNHLMHHNKYKNNYDYNRSLLLLNHTQHLASDYVMLYENEDIVSPVSIIYYEYYKELPVLQERLKARSAEIQCIVTQDPQMIEGALAFGEAQSPELWDYADNMDTLEFLVNV